MKLSTKNKVIAGFLLVIFVVVALAFIGVRTTRNITALFGAYNHAAVLSTTVSSMEAALNLGAYKTIKSSWFYDQADKDDAVASVDKALSLLAQAKAEATRPERKKMLETWEAELSEYKAQVIVYLDSVFAIGDIMDAQEMRSKDITKRLDALSEQARISGDAELSKKFFDLRSAFVELDASLFQYVERQDEALKPPVDTAVEVLNSQRSSLLNGYAAGRADVEQLNNIIDQYLNAYNEIHTPYMVGIFKSDELRLRIESEIFGQMNNLNAELNKEYKELSASISDQNSFSLKILLIVSVLGVLMSLIVMGIIVVGIMRTLKAMSNYADEVSHGHFDANLSVHEPGELGLVATSLRNIPLVLSKIVAEYKNLSTKVTNGYLHERASVEGCEGEYASLVNETNALMDDMGDVLDLMPAMVIAHDVNYTVTYLNESAHSILGEIKGQQCPEIFRTKVGEPTDPKKQPRAEFDDLEGRHRHVSISATPNVSPQGKVVGSIIVLNDITAINEAYSVMIEVAKEADAYSERLVTAAEELSAQVSQITSGTEIQRDQVNSTATAMEEMNATVLDVARNAAEASRQSDETSKKANEGDDLVDLLVNNINRVNKIATGLHTDMQELGKQAEAIGGVMDVISDIADQTNLLALNAAIEAARAGEAGRGFAVVADEVRKLAEKTMSATSEVGSSIQAIQSSAVQNIKNVSDAVTSVTEANEMANTSGMALKDIVKMANDSSLLISGIATAAEEQSATSEEINRAVEGISQIAGETAHGMAESSAALHELSGVAQQLKELLVRLNAVTKSN